MIRLASTCVSLLLLLAAGGCGASTGLDPGAGPAPGDGGPGSGDGSVRNDAGPLPGRDAGPLPGRDAGPLPGRDAGPPPSLQCVNSGTPFFMATQPGTLAWPALARLGDRPLLTWTNYQPDGRGPIIESQVLRPNGRPRGGSGDVFPGAEGGSLLAVPVAGAYVIVAHLPDGSLQPIALDTSGHVASPPDMPLPLMTSSFRPGLAVGSTSYALGWNQGMDHSLMFVARAMSMTMDPSVLMLDGRDPWIVPRRGAADQYRVSSFQNDTVSVRTVDIDANVLDVQRIRERGEQVLAARVLESPSDDVMAILTAPSGPSRTRVRIVGGGTSVSTDVPEAPVDMGAAADPDLGWSLAAISTVTPASRMRVHALITDGSAHARLDFSWLGAPMGPPAHPAVLALGSGRFLVAWETRHLPSGGAIRGVIVHCDVTTH